MITQRANPLIRYMSASVLSVTALLFSVPLAQTETLSNRHHLSGCTNQSAPVVIPHATHRTVRLGLPPDLAGPTRITTLVGEQRDHMREHYGDHHTPRIRYDHERAGVVVLQTLPTTRC